MAKPLIAASRFNVICLDNEIEIRTPTEIAAGQVCLQFSNISKDYELFYGGTYGGFRFCDFQAEATVNGTILQDVNLNFLDSCNGTSLSFSCPSILGRPCSASMGGMIIF